MNTVHRVSMMVHRSLYRKFVRTQLKIWIQRHATFVLSNPVVWIGDSVVQFKDIDTELEQDAVQYDSQSYMLAYGMVLHKRNLCDTDCFRDQIYTIVFHSIHQLRNRIFTHDSHSKLVYVEHIKWLSHQRKPWWRKQPRLRLALYSIYHFQAIFQAPLNTFCIQMFCGQRLCICLLNCRVWCVKEGTPTI